MALPSAQIMRMRAVGHRICASRGTTAAGGEGHAGGGEVAQLGHQKAQAFQGVGADGAVFDGDGGMGEEMAYGAEALVDGGEGGFGVVRDGMKQCWRGPRGIDASAVRELKMRKVLQQLLHWSLGVGAAGSHPLSLARGEAECQRL